MKRFLGIVGILGMIGILALVIGEQALGATTEISLKGVTAIPSITVTSPNGGEVWERNKTYEIKWTSSGGAGANVEIQLWKGEVINQGIIASTENDGSYQWTVPSNQDFGTNYRIKISSTSISVSDFSDNYFSIQAFGVIEGKVKNEKDVGLPNITLELLVDPEGPVLKSTITTSDGSYRFNNLPAGKYKWRPTTSGYNYDPSYWSVTFADDHGYTTGNFIATTSPLYSISGYVRDGSGNGIKGVGIGYYRNGEFKGTFWGTNENGKYELSNLAPGNYKIEPVSDSYAFDPPCKEVTIGPNAENVNFSVTQEKPPYAASLDVSPPTTNLYEGWSTTFTIVLKNIGKNSDTYRLSVSGSVNFNYEEIKPSPSTTLVSPNNSWNFTQKITCKTPVPGNYTIKWKVKSDGANEDVAEVSAVITIPAVQLLSLAVSFIGPGQYESCKENESATFTYHTSLVDEKGNAVKEATISIKDHLTGVLTQIYTNNEGTANYTTTTGPNGKTQGQYNIIFGPVTYGTKTSNQATRTVTVVSSGSYLLLAVIPTADQTINPGGSVTYTMKVKDQNVNPVPSATVDVNDTLTPLHIDRGTDKDGIAYYTVTVPQGKAEGKYSIEFVAKKDGYTQSDKEGRYVNVIKSTPPTQLQITTTSLPQGGIGAYYQATLQASGGSLPYLWSKDSGSLPDGLSLFPTGVISGFPTKAGISAFTIKVTDSSSPVQTATKELSITIKNVALPAPSTLTAIATSLTQINLTWQDNSNNEAGFKIERRIGIGGTWGQIKVVPANTNSYSDTNISSGITYYYRVKGYNSEGESDYSNETSATTPITINITKSLYYDFGLTGIVGADINALSVAVSKLGIKGAEVSAEVEAGKGLRLTVGDEKSNEHLYLTRKTQLGGKLELDIGKVEYGVADVSAFSEEASLKGLLSLEYLFDNPFEDATQAQVLTAMVLLDFINFGASVAPGVGPVVTTLVEAGVGEISHNYRHSVTTEGAGVVSAGVGTVKTTVGKCEISGVVSESVLGGSRGLSIMGTDYVKPQEDGVISELGGKISGSFGISLPLLVGVEQTSELEGGVEYGEGAVPINYYLEGTGQKKTGNTIFEQTEMESYRLTIPRSVKDSIIGKDVGGIIDKVAQAGQIILNPIDLANGTIRTGKVIEEVSKEQKTVEVATLRRCREEAAAISLGFKVDIGAAEGVGGGIEVGASVSFISGKKWPEDESVWRNGGLVLVKDYVPMEPVYPRNDLNSIMTKIISKAIEPIMNKIKEKLEEVVRDVKKGTIETIETIAKIANGVAETKTKIIVDGTKFAGDVTSAIVSYVPNIPSIQTPCVNKKILALKAESKVKAYLSLYRSKNVSPLRKILSEDETPITIISKVHSITVKDKNTGVLIEKFPNDEVKIGIAISPALLSNVGFSETDVNKARMFYYNSDTNTWEEVSSKQKFSKGGDTVVESNVLKGGGYALGILEVPPSSLPASPSNLTTGTISTTEVNLTWQDNSDNETGFKIERKIAGGSYQEIATIGFNETNYKDVSLFPNTTYSYRIRAYNLNGVSDYSNEIIAAIVVQTQILTVGTSGCNFSKIQNAINAALDGNTVLVNSGIYVENIDFLGKSIIVQSINGPGNTIIDGNKTGSVVTFKSGESKNSVLSGFTIRNGLANYGGGIYCGSLSSSPVIANCIIGSNTANNGGGGIYCNKNSSPTITDCIIGSNIANYNSGGGIYCVVSSPAITNCYITNNMSRYGGGIECSQSSPIINNCVINSNKADDYGGGIYCSDSSPAITNCNIISNMADCGGGIACYRKSSPAITNCNINGNIANYHYGGGIYCKEECSPIITNCTINSNTTTGAHGGGIYCYNYSSAVITNCVITNNKSRHDGGGMYCSKSSPKITNCTFSDNDAEDDGDVICCYKSSPTVINSILWCSNSTSVIYLEESSSINITYSDVKGGWTGEGNIKINPLCVGNGDYHLTSASPCLDKGSSEMANLPSIDRDGNPRVMAPEIDMGAYEYVNSNSPPAKFGSISITSTPFEAKIYLDGADITKITPTILTKIKTGSHTIKLTKTGYKDWIGSITVIASQTIYLQGTLIILPVEFGSISIASTPSEAKIYLDEVNTSRLTSANFATTPGIYTVILTKTGYENWIGSITVIASKTAYLYGTLTAITDKFGSISIVSVPQGAKIYLDEVDINKTTPAILSSVLVGTHTIRLTKTGYKDWMGSATVVSRQTIYLQGTLTGLGVLIISDAKGALGETITATISINGNKEPVIPKCNLMSNF